MFRGAIAEGHAEAEFAIAEAEAQAVELPEAQAAELREFQCPSDSDIEFAQAFSLTLSRACTQLHTAAKASR